MKWIACLITFLIPLGAPLFAVVSNLPTSERHLTGSMTICDDYVTSGFPGKPLRNVSLTTKKFYVFTSYLGFSSGTHKYSCQFFNNKNELFFSSERKIDVSTDDFWTTTSYSPNRFADLDGEWKISVSIDGVELVSTTVLVAPYSDPEKKFSIVADSLNFTKSEITEGGNYFYGGLEYEPIKNTIFSVGYTTQVLPNPFADGLASLSFTRYLFGRESLYSSVSLIYANSIRSVGKGLVGLQFTPFDSWDAAGPSFFLFPLTVLNNLDNGQWVFAYHIFGLKFRL